jgi:hypothetical protein
MIPIFCLPYKRQKYLFVLGLFSLRKVKSHSIFVGGDSKKGSELQLQAF